MGFYIRKSVRVGPLRFNLSRSGIGVSAGVPGFRVGMGPRGNYIHAGRGGFYYRATLGSHSHASGAPTTPPVLPSHSLGAPAGRPTLGPDVAIDSGSVQGMRDESAASLLSELNTKRSRIRLGPLALCVLAAMLLYAWTQLPPAGQIAMTVGAVLMMVAAFLTDAMRKTTVIMYDLDADATASFQALIDSLLAIGQSQRLWHVESRAAVLDRKYHAGAQSEIRRSSTSVSLGTMPFVKCNVDVPKVSVGRQSLFFMPDRLLVFDSGSVGAVPYAQLVVREDVTRFIESDGVPPESRVVGRTWRYVNKGGGPDRRFRDNREIPICEYSAIHLTSPSGLNELLHSSKVGVAQPLIRYLALEGPRLTSAAMRSGNSALAT